MADSKLRRRLRALEQNVASKLVTLVMPDGRRETFRGAVRDLFGRALAGDGAPAELIARSISSTEPDGGHLIALARAILNSPLE